MTVKMISEPDYDLLPVVCTCIFCRKQCEATEFADFKLEHSSGNDGSFTLFGVKCPACGNYSCPPKKDEKALIDSYELWVRLGKPARRSWTGDFHCPECRTDSEISRRNLSVGWTEDSANYGGDTPTYEVKVICPVCETRSPANSSVPRGIKEKMLENYDKTRI